MQIIPAIDLRAGHVVRLIQGRYDAEQVYSHDAVGLAMSFAEQGASALHVVDLDGARDGAFPNLELIERIAHATGLLIQAGGGVRSSEHVARLLGAGASRVVVGSMAVREPEKVVDWLATYGADAITVALDVRENEAGEYEIHAAGWIESTGVAVWQGLQRFRGTGLKHLLCTDIARDGMLRGPNLALYRALAQSRPDLTVIASGGVAELTDLTALRAAGAGAVVIGKALLDGHFGLREALACG